MITLMDILKLSSKMDNLFAIVFFLCLNECWCSTVADFSKLDRILDDPAYDSKVRPGVETGKVSEVMVSVFINDISSVSEVNMDYTLDIYFRQIWKDERLAGFNDTLFLHHKHLSKLWVPDAYFQNEKKASRHDVTVPNTMILLQPDGTIIYSHRLTLVLGCVLKLEKYPMDNQTCLLKICSYRYPVTNVLLLWRDYGPIQNNTELRLPEYKFTESYNLSYLEEYTFYGFFSVLVAELHFQREVAYYISQTFVPSSLIVILSWVSFWIDYHAVPARITLGLLTVLTITTQSSGISQRLPRVSYTKAIDVWMSTCLVFVFAALLEYSLVNVLARMDAMVHLKEVDKGKREDIRDNESGVSAMSGSVSNEGIPTELANGIPKRNGKTVPNNRTTYKTTWLRSLLPKEYQHEMAQFVDVVSRVFFPCCFILFNAFYWSIYNNV